MSPLLSDNGGTRTGTTFKRWYRSSRNRPAANLPLEIPAGRGHDADIDRHVGRATYALKNLIDDHPKDLVLRFERHVADFVDKERAHVRLFEGSDFSLLCAVDWLRAKQLDFHPLRRNCGRIDDDEMVPRHDRKCHELRVPRVPCRARRTDNQDPAIGRRDLFDRLRNWLIVGEFPTNVEGASCLNAFTSRLSREFSNARWATSNNRSALNGFFDKIVGTLP